MMMYEKPLEDAVLLYWHTTPALREANYFGVREQIIRANRLNHHRIREVLPARGYVVLGNIEELEHLEAPDEIERVRQTHYINEDGLRVLMFDLFRQGYIGAGFYIVCFNADDSPIETSNP